MKLGSSQLNSFSAFTAKKKVSEMLVENFALQVYALNMIIDKIRFQEVWLPFFFYLRLNWFSYKRPDYMN